ncbi:MAG: UDP-N-acetylmuramoyl-tripeptide--D-alanyl-D-alanine ligase [Gallionella sp.]
MMLLSTAAEALNGQLVGEDAQFDGVSSDSRKISQGDLFIALRGEHFDGYKFIENAARDGAVAVLVNADSYQGEQYACPMLLVEDTRIALGALAAYWRKQFQIPLIAITGSNGKTTVKEMLASILRVTAGSADAVLSTEGNLNNDIGMPLTLLKLNAAHRYAVIEMGMNHPGEIDYLSRIAVPDVALINNASDAHLEGMGTVKAVAQAKGEILNGLSAYGTAVINADDDNAPLWRELAGAHQLLEFGLNPDADVHGTWQPEEHGLLLDVTAPQGMFCAALQVAGEHNARNALAAATAAVELNVPLEKIATGLENFAGVAGRLQRKAGICGAMLIDDSYNANPASMSAAIKVLSDAQGKQVLVIGDMGELGGEATKLHEAIGKEAKRVGIDKLFTFGKLSKRATHEFGEGAQHFEQLDKLLPVLKDELDESTTVLVKGSRFMHMERVVQYLEVGAENDSSLMKEKACS